MPKFTTLAVLIVCLILSSTACDNSGAGTGGSNTATLGNAKDTVEAFSKAVIADDWATADGLLTGNIKASYGSTAKDDLTNNGKNPVKSYTLGDEWRRGQTATVDATWQQDRTQYLRFVLYGTSGSWKIVALYREQSAQPTPPPQATYTPPAPNLGNAKDVVAAFSAAYQAEDWATAESYLARGSDAYMRLAAGVGGALALPTKHMLGLKSYTIDEPSVNGDTATLNATWQFSDKAVQPAFELTNTDGKWQITRTTGLGYLGTKLCHASSTTLTNASSQPYARPLLGRTIWTFAPATSTCEAGKRWRGQCIRGVRVDNAALYWGCCRVTAANFGGETSHLTYSASKWQEYWARS